MVKVFDLLNLNVKKQRKSRKHLAVLLHVTDVQLIKEGPGVSMNGICVERGTRMVVLDELVSFLNPEKAVLLERCIEALILNVRDTNILCR